MSTSVQPAKEAESKSSSASRSALIWIVITASIAAVVVFSIAGSSAGKEFLRQRVHPFRVISVNADTKTMTVVHGNQSYVIRCEERCGSFKPATDYPMQEKGWYLELRHGGETLNFPILEEQTTFDTLGGHG